MRPRIKVRLKAIAKRYVSFNFASGFALWIETPRRNSWRMKKVNSVENKLELHERIDLLCAHRAAGSPRLRQQRYDKLIFRRPFSDLAGSGFSNLALGPADIGRYRRQEEK